MTDNQTPFKPTQVFTHKYANENILRTYLVDTAGLKKDQFLIKVSFILPVGVNLQILSYTQIQDHDIQIQITGEPSKLEEVSLVLCGWLQIMG